MTATFSSVGCHSLNYAPGSSKVLCGYQYTVFTGVGCIGDSRGPFMQGSEKICDILHPQGDGCGGFQAASIKLERVENMIDWNFPFFGSALPAQKNSYSIQAGNVGNTFQIDPVSGLIRVAKDNALNHENQLTDGQYTLVIAAADKAGLSMVFTGIRHFKH